MESSHGLILIHAQIRRPDIRAEFWQHFEDLPGERVAPTIYELSIADWGDGLWRAELDWIRDLFEGTLESAVIWQFGDGGFSRFTVRGDA